MNKGSKIAPQRFMELEGLRGIAAIIVVIFHTLLIFYPGMMYGPHSVTLTVQNSHIESMMFGNPLNVFLSGGFAVGIFFVLSGFVLTIGFFQTKDQSVIKKLAVKRYLRLMLPALASILVVWIILSLGLQDNKTQTEAITHSGWLATMWHFVPNIFDAFKQGFWSIFVTGDVSYNPVLWTMKYEFIGSFIVFAAALLFASSKHRWLFYVVAILLSFNTWYVGFIVGLLLADLYTHRTKLYVNAHSQAIGWCVLVVGLVCGGYPASSAQGTIYENIKLPMLTDVENFSIYLSFGAACLVFATLSLPQLTRFFKKPRISGLGKYTYSLYLTHKLILFTVCTTIFVHLEPKLGLNKSALISIIGTIPFLMLTTFLFERYVDKPSIILSGYFAKWFNGVPRSHHVAPRSDDAMEVREKTVESMI